MAFNIVSEIDDGVKISNVLMSVSDKGNLDLMVKGLIAVNPDVKIYSTGGTFSKVKEILGDQAEKNLIAVSDYTKQPEMQGGLVKTLDFKIYLGLLSETYNEDHRRDLKRIEAIDFDMVVVNLYPFKQTIAQKDITVENARGNIDIGGPCMCRASAKNFIRVASVVNPSDYSSLIEELKANKGILSFATRFKLAKTSFRHTADYDASIASYLESLSVEESVAAYKMHNQLS